MNKFTVRTRSGDLYLLKAKASESAPALPVFLWARKVGSPDTVPVIGIFPDRLPFLLSTVTWAAGPGGKLDGFNAKGTRTLRFDPLKLSKGMILANRHGLATEEIVEITTLSAVTAAAGTL